METDNINSVSFWIAYSIANLLALTLVWSSKKYLGYTKAAFFIIFIGAAAVIAYIALDSPWANQHYAETTIPLDKTLILGIFEAIIKPMILTIPIALTLVALSMLLKGRLFRFGCVAGIVLCLCLARLGWYVAFPAPLLLAVALFRLQKPFAAPRSEKKPGLAPISSAALT